MKLSVITLTYNREHLLEECAYSLRQCAIDEAEFLVWDDASVDGTDVCLWMPPDSRFRYFRQPVNKGFAGNMADAMAAAAGEYVCTLSDDDISLPGNFEKKVAILDAHPQVGLVYSLAGIIDAEGKDVGQCWRSEYTPYSYSGGRDEFGDLLCGNYLPGPSVVFRRSLLEEYGGYDPNLASTLSDWDLWLRYSRAMETAFIAEPLVKFRVHDGGMSADRSEMAFGMIPVWRKWLVRHDAPVIGSRAWMQMQAMFRAEVQRNSPEREVEAQAEFRALYNDHLAAKLGTIELVAA